MATIYRLKEARKLSGMTLRQAAEKLRKEQGIDWSFQYLGKIEKEGCGMDSQTLVKIANLYEVSVDYLIPNPNRPKIELKDVHFHKLNKNRC